MMKAVVGCRRIGVGLLLVVAGCYTGLPDPEGDGLAADTEGGAALTSPAAGDDGDDPTDGDDPSAGGDPSADEGGDATGDEGGDPSGDGGDPSGDDGDPSADDGGSEGGVPGEDGICGDGVQQDDEECDEGPLNGEGSGCTTDCTLNVCGDAVLGPGEGCDDGNDQDGDGCSAECALPSCGDGTVDRGEACDDGNDTDTDACTSACTAPACGDGYVQAGEACDDGNGSNVDACTTACEPAACGDGYVQAGEECDDGNGNGNDACSNACETQMPSDLPDNAYCDGVAGWDEAWVDLEAQVLVLVNQKRAQVIDCGGGNVLGPSPPVSYDPALTCAARNHSLDMAQNDFFSHTNLQGQGPSQRLQMAGYAWSTWGENIAAGYATAQQVVDGWIESQGHCVNLMNPAFEELGVGHAYEAGSEYGHYWTQSFGTPP